MKKQSNESTQCVLDVLNKARSMELHAIHQYMNQHFNLDDMDYGVFADKIKVIAIDEMKHAEKLAERIKTLGGQPTHDLSEKIIREQELNAVFPYNKNLEDGAIAAYNEFIAVCRENGDNVSADLLRTILQEEQDHVDYFDDTLGHLTRLGDVYLARIAGMG